jgi:predicted MFS family arabinose efflux permease
MAIAGPRDGALAAPGGSGCGPLLTPALARVLLASFAGLTSFYLLLSVVPRYAATSGAGAIGAGLATGALFFATTLTEIATPRLVAWSGYRPVFAAGLLLLGAPALGLGASSGMAAVVAVCLLRGVGLAIVVVVGSALVPALVPAGRRGEGLGLYGLVVGVPAVAALPLGLWLAAHVGYRPVFVVAALSALAGLAALPGMALSAPAAAPAAGVRAALRTPGLRRPALLFLATAIAGGIVVTFVPLAAPAGPGEAAALALLAFGAASTLSRWWAGRFEDCHPSADLLRPAVLAVGLGMAALVLIDHRLALFCAATVIGAGFGVAQNASLNRMFGAAPATEYDSVSAVWNLAYDTGLGVGGAGFGVLTGWTGYPWGFALSALLILALAAPGATRPGPARRSRPTRSRAAG